jgi:hypothetical protein
MKHIKIEENGIENAQVNIRSLESLLPFLDKTMLVSHACWQFPFHRTVIEGDLTIQTCFISFFNILFVL